MLRDLVRTACLIAAMAVAASLVVEVRFRLAVIDAASRPQVYGWAPAPVQPAPGRLRAAGRAAIEFADAALGVVR